MRQCKTEERGVPGTLTDGNTAMTHSDKYYVCVVSAQILAVILSHIFGFSRASSVSPPVCVGFSAGLRDRVRDSAPTNLRSICAGPSDYLNNVRNMKMIL